MKYLLGEFECKVDQKGRFVLPSGLKKQLSETGSANFVINRGFEGCLVLYPEEVWSVNMKKLGRLNLFNKKNRQFYRQFLNGATNIVLDRTNRVLLPKGLMHTAGISRAIMLFAIDQHVEIWSKEKYEEMIADELDSQLAEEVMGKVDDDNLVDDKET